MPLKAWNIASFPGATPEAPVTRTLVEVPVDKVTMSLSLFIANNSGTDDITVTIRRMAAGTAELFKWSLDIPQGNFVFALDSKIVLGGNESLTVTSTNPDVAVDVNANEDFFHEENIDYSPMWRKVATTQLVVLPVPTISVSTQVTE